MRKGLEKIEGDMGKGLEQIEKIKDDMGNIGEKLESLMNRTEEMADEDQICILPVNYLLLLTCKNYEIE